MPVDHCVACLCDDTTGSEMVNDGATWVQCAQCGLMYDRLGDPKVDESIAEMKASPVPSGTPTPLFADEQAWKNVLDGIFARIPGTSASKVLFEVGCGTGQILAYAKSLGIEAVGSDVCARQVLAAMARGLAVRYEDASHWHSSTDMDGRCDLVIANQVMEHVQDPRELARRIRKMLSPSGIFWATYCHDGPLPSSLVKRGEARWWTMRAVSYVIEQAGMEILDAQWTMFSMNVTARVATVHPDAVARRR